MAQAQGSSSVAVCEAADCTISAADDERRADFGSAGIRGRSPVMAVVIKKVCYMLEVHLIIKYCRKKRERGRKQFWFSAIDAMD
jgi:hypothetical protein